MWTEQDTLDTKCSRVAKDTADIVWIRNLFKYDDEASGTEGRELCVGDFSRSLAKGEAPSMDMKPDDVLEHSGRANINGQLVSSMSEEVA